jgi:hypothetical protein
MAMAIMRLGWAYLTETVRKPASRSTEGLTSIPLWFFVLVLWKMPQLLPKCPRATFAQNKKFYPQKRVFGAQVGCGDVTSLYKNLLKNRKTNFLRQVIQEPIFPVAHTDFEGGGDGRGCGVRHFFGQIGPAQPYYDTPKRTRVPASVGGRPLQTWVRPSQPLHLQPFRVSLRKHETALRWPFCF